MKKWLISLVIIHLMEVIAILIIAGLISFVAFSFDKVIYFFQLDGLSYAFRILFLINVFANSLHYKDIYKKGFFK